MKTQKEIQTRIDFLCERVAEIESAISEENARWFPNKTAITYLRKLADDHRAEVVHLSWVLV